MDSVGQQRMAQLHGGRRDKLEISPESLGRRRPGARRRRHGTGRRSRDRGRARSRNIRTLGIDTFILSGYPHLEEAYRFAELVFPLLPIAARSTLDAASRQYRAVRRDHRQRACGRCHDRQRNHEPDRKPSARCRHAAAACRRPDPVDRAAGSSLLVWQAACVDRHACSARVLPAPTRRGVAGWKLLRRGELARNIWVSFWRASAGFVDRRRHRLCVRARQRPVATLRQADRHAPCRWCATFRIWR